MELQALVLVQPPLPGFGVESIDFAQLLQDVTAGLREALEQLYKLAPPVRQAIGQQHLHPLVHLGPVVVEGITHQHRGLQAIRTLAQQVCPILPGVAGSTDVDGGASAILELSDKARCELPGAILSRGALLLDEPDPGIVTVQHGGLGSLSDQFLMDRLEHLGRVLDQLPCR